MDIFTRILNENAWRFPKGYPELENNEDVKLLKKIFEEIIGDDLDVVLEEPVDLSQEAIDILKKEFDLKDEDFKPLSSTRFKVLMDNSERTPFIEKVKQMEDFEHEFKGGSKGQLKYKNKVIFLPKPRDMQGRYSSGKENEDIFLNRINNAIEENGGKIDITLNSPKYKEEYKNVTRAEDSSVLGASGGDKSDVRLYSNNTLLANISIKKDGGFRWATVRGLFPDFLENLIKKGTNGEIPTLEFQPREERENKYLMFNPQTGERVTLVIIEDIPNKIDEVMIFGPEVPKVIVVSKSFMFGDFTVEEETLNIDVSSIYKNMDDVEEAGAEPIIILAQHINQKFGIDFRAYPAFMAKLGPKQKGIVLNYNDIT